MQRYKPKRISVGRYERRHPAADITMNSKPIHRRLSINIVKRRLINGDKYSRPRRAPCPLRNASHAARFRSHFGNDITRVAITTRRHATHPSGVTVSVDDATDGRAVTHHPSPPIECQQPAKRTHVSQPTNKHARTAVNSDRSTAIVVGQSGSVADRHQVALMMARRRAANSLSVR